MSSIDGVGAVPNGSSQAAGLGDLDSDAFLRLLVAQMRYQDPMSPADHTAMLQQTSQFTQVEALQQVSELQQQLLGLSQAHMASSLVGQEVTADTGEGEPVTGVVQGVRFADDGPMLDLGDAEVPLRATTAVGAASAATAAGAYADVSADGAPEPWTGPWSHDSETGGAPQDSQNTDS